MWLYKIVYGRLGIRRFSIILMIPLWISVSNSKVEIRDWSTLTPTQPTHSKKHKHKANDNRQFLKTRLCWFNPHHPDGCPRLAGDCQFAHGAEELQKLSVSLR